MTFIDIVYIITGPTWLKAKISLIALLFAGCFLAYFGGFVHGKVIFPISDWIRQRTHEKISETRAFRFSKVISYTVSTIIFILYPIEVLQVIV